MGDQQPKVFGVGLNKTGTTTLAVMGAELGYNCTSWDRGLLGDVVARHDFTRLFQVADSHDFFEDVPWALVYREMDERYPGSRFVLTTRKSEQAWLASMKKHSLHTSVRGHDRMSVYGPRYPHGNEEHYLAVYRKHAEDVRAYFADRPGDLLELCWERGDGWEELCRFLDRPIPNLPVPHSNASSELRTPRKRHLVNAVLAKFAQLRSVRIGHG